MNKFLEKHQEYAIFGLISVLVVAWNIVTMEYSVPWCDEVMLADTPATMHFYGEWATTAYMTMGEGSQPFSLYLPLYTWVLYAWISVFGFSFIKVRLCELLTAVLIGGVMLGIGKQVSKQKLSLLSVVLFSLGFWFTDILLNTYRQARPDMLGALMTIIVFYYLIKCLKSSKNYTWQLVLFSALSLAAGVQSAIYLVFGLIFAALFVRPVKKMLRPAICCLVGFVLGFIVVCLYMACFGQLRPFIVGIMNSSGTVMKLYGLAREIVFPLMGKEVTPLGLPKGSNIPLYIKLMDIFTNLGAVILLVVNIVLLAINQVWKQTKENNIPFFVFLFSLFVILGFNLAGRYPGYYMWTAIFPMLLSLMLWMNQGKSVLSDSIVGIAMIFITISALTRYPLSGETPCDRINAFIGKQHFKASDKIATPFSTFYALKPTHPNSYFYQVYPDELMGDVDYIIIPEYEGEYNQESMEKYLKDCQANPKLKVTKISTMKDPDLAMYRVTKH